VIYLYIFNVAVRINYRIINHKIMLNQFLNWKIGFLPQRIIKEYTLQFY